MELRHVKHPFDAIIDERCRVLILGSVPSVKSVENNFYYAHPRNRFWQIMSLILGEDFLSADCETRASLLLKHNIALYDVVDECDIEGSADAKIKNAKPTDIPALINKTEIRKIFCNGSKAHRLLLKFHKNLPIAASKLPSTSPLNTAVSLADLETAWRAILQY